MLRVLSSRLTVKQVIRPVLGGQLSADKKIKYAASNANIPDVKHRKRNEEKPEKIIPPFAVCHALITIEQKHRG